MAGDLAGGRSAYLELTICTETCQGSDEYGLIFRVPDIHDAGEGYLFGFTCDGRYFLRTWDGENMDSLVGATAASAIQAGSDKTNRIGVWAEDDEFSLYANGTFLVKIQDATFPDEGGFGFFIGGAADGGVHRPVGRNRLLGHQLTPGRQSVEPHEDAVTGVLPFFVRHHSPVAIGRGIEAEERHVSQGSQPPSLRRFLSNGRSKALS